MNIQKRTPEMAKRKQKAECIFFVWICNASIKYPP